MKILSFSAEVILTIGCLFTSLAFPDSDSIRTDSEPVSVVDSSTAVTVSACDPVAASCAECNSGSLSAAPNCGFCAACGNADCNGLCDSCIPQGCTANFFGNLKKTLCEGVRWSGYIKQTSPAIEATAWSTPGITQPQRSMAYMSPPKKRRLLAAMALTSATELT